MAVMTLTSENFEAEVLKSEGVVAVDFWASWCGPCKMFMPVVEEIEKEAGPELKIGKVNIDEQPDLAERYRVMTIPTFMVFKDGKPVDSSIGVQPKKKVLEMLENAK